MSARSAYARWYRLTRNVDAALRLGDVSRQIEEFKTALGWYSRARKSAKEQQLAQAEMDADIGIGMCWRGLEKFSEAIRRLKKCSTAYRKRNDQEGFAYALWALGTTQRFAGRLSAAEKNLRQSVRLYEKLGDKNGLAYARCGLGGTLRMRGKNKESFGHYQWANRVFKIEKDRFGEAYSNCGQGNALRMQGKVMAALPYMTKAEVLYRKLGQKGPLAFVLWSRAQAEISLKKFSSAKKRIAESRRIFKSVSDPRGLVYADLGEGQLLMAQNDPRCFYFFRRVLKAARLQKFPLETGYARRRLRLKKRPCKIIEIP